MHHKILVSAGEPSGDRYAGLLVEELRRRFPDAEFFGCAGEKMQSAGVRPVVDASSLSVVGLFEVVSHIPRIYREYRKMVAAAAREKPKLAILTDSPDFHLRLARRLKRLGIPVVYLVAPQVWAWRKSRLHTMRRHIDRLLCIFPFEETFFRQEGVAADYIGHPLARIVKPSLEKDAFFRKHGLPQGRPLIAVLPGSRKGEAARHLPVVLDAVSRIRRKRETTFLLAASAGLFRDGPAAHYSELIRSSAIQVVEGDAWDALAHCDLALAASGTVTVEAALLGTPMVTFYRVSGLSWHVGRRLVRVPFYSMVNLVAERGIVPELIQNELTGKRLAAETERLLDDDGARSQMRKDLTVVAEKLTGTQDPMVQAADIVEGILG